MKHFPYLVGQAGRFDAKQRLHEREWREGAHQRLLGTERKGDLPIRDAQLLDEGMHALVVALHKLDRVPDVLRGRIDHDLAATLAQREGDKRLAMLHQIATERRGRLQGRADVQETNLDFSHRGVDVGRRAVDLRKGRGQALARAASEGPQAQPTRGDPALERGGNHGGDAIGPSW